MLVLTVLMLQVCASAELNLDVTFDENGFISDTENWYYFGYTYGGVTFVVPTDSYSYPLDDAQKEAGIILVTGNADYTLQLRSFEPEVMTYKDLKQQMKKKILVEGVETVDHIKLLKKLQVDYLQGFYFSKPLPVDEFLRKYAVKD